MQKTIPTLASLLVAVTVGTNGASAQSNVLRHGETTVEVLGLRLWTLEMLQDSLAKYSPQDSLHTRGCAAALRYKVGFADAAAMGFLTNGREHTVIVVREPQDSARAQLRPAKFDTTGARPRWADLVQARRSKRRAFDYALATYPEHAAAETAQPISAAAGADSIAVRQVWAILRGFRSERDRRTATLALLSDPNFENRLAAAAVLGNFPTHDETWWSLIEAMREDDGVVKGAAANIATGLATAAPRRVDWTPVLPALAAMLDGTSPFSLRPLLLVLEATELSAEHAAVLVSGGDQLIFEFAGALEPKLHEPARKLLARLSGHDLDGDVAAWRAWARELEPADGSVQPPTTASRDRPSNR